MIKTKTMTAKYAGKCRECGRSFPAGAEIVWGSETGALHPECAEAGTARAAERIAAEGAATAAAVANEPGWTMRSAEELAAMQAAAEVVTDEQRKYGFDEKNSKACGRCGGSGHYSYNMMHGSTCYGCHGRGRVWVTPKGQKAIKPTAKYDEALVGDIIEYAGTIYRVERISWNARRFEPQTLHLVRLIDDKKFRIYRVAYNRIPGREDGALQGVNVSAEMVGKPAEGKPGEWVVF